MFTSAASKTFLGFNQFFCKSLTIKKGFFSLIQNGYFLQQDAQPNGRIMDTLTRSGQAYPKCQYQLVRNFNVYLHATNKLYQYFFLNQLHITTNFLFLVLRICLASSIRNDNGSLIETLMFICKQMLLKLVFKGALRSRLCIQLICIFQQYGYNLNNQFIFAPKFYNFDKNNRDLV